MDCNYNISDLVAKHLLKDEFSFKIHMSCLNCQYVEKCTPTVLKINVKPFYTGNMGVLEHTINKQYTYSNKKCTRCNGENIDHSIVCGQLLFIECLQWSNLVKNLNISDWEGTFTLSQIPVDLQFRDCAYKLLAAVEYEGTQDTKTIGHYIAHIRRVSGKWETHNNFCQSKRPLTASQRVLLQKRKISLLIFIKINNTNN